MVKYRRRQFKRRGRKTQWYNKKYNAMQLASAAWKGVNYIKGLVNSEMFTATYTANINPTPSGVVLNLTQLAQGDGNGARTGLSVFFRKINARFSVVNNSTAGQVFHRWILFIDKQQIGDTSPSATDVLETADVRSSLNPNTAGRFKILKNWEFYTSQLSSDCKIIKYYKNFRHHVRYNNTSSSDIQKGGIYMLFLSNQSTNTPVVSYNIKTSYHDN